MMVDDEKIVHFSLAPYLEDCGHEVVGFYDGQSALENLKKERYDLALVDVFMKEVDGIEFVERCQKIAPELPIILVTAHADEELIDSIKKKGAVDYLKKPFKLLDLDAMIEKYT